MSHWCEFGTRGKEEYVEVLLLDGAARSASTRSDRLVEGRAIASLLSSEQFSGNGELAQRGLLKAARSASLYVAQRGLHGAKLVFSSFLSLFS